MADGEKCPYGEGRCPITTRLETEMEIQRRDISTIKENMNHLTDAVNKLVAESMLTREKIKELENNVKYIVLIGLAIFGQQIMAMFV